MSRRVFLSTFRSVRKIFGLFSSPPSAVHCGRRWSGCVLLGALSMGLVGCATAPQPPAEASLQAAIEQQGMAPQEVMVPFSLDPEMAAWAHRIVPTGLAPSDRLEVLAEALLTGEELELQYVWGYTGSAREVFDTGQANCLAFTNLFLAMARELEVPVYFLAVETETYRRHEDFVVVSDHIAVGYGPGPEIQMFDFAPREGSELRRVRRISDLTALAMFYANRGAEVLQVGDLKGSLDHLRRAVRLQPGLASGWINLGVARRRAGDLEGAEEAYHQALQLDPTVYAGYQNLAALLSSMGRHDEARLFSETLRRSSHGNPFTFVSLGDISLRRGRWAEARRLYKRAIHLDRQAAESYAALGQLAVVRGDLHTARRMLRKARRIDGDNARTLRLANMMPSEDGQSEDG